MLVVAVGCVVTVLILLFHRGPKRPGTSVGGQESTPGTDVQTRSHSADFPKHGHREFGFELPPAKTAEQIVHEKVRQFAQKRRELARRVAKSQNRQVSPDAEAFFDAVDAGNWDEIRTRWKLLADRSGQYEGSGKPARDPDWPEILDAYGVAEQAHLWPAQKLLDYGQAVLGSLKPGMIYVGGTDPGRWIPELLNETGEGEPHIIITQNALADNTYLEFVNTLYGQQISALSSEDSQKIFQEYLQDAQNRLQHDQQFPDEPKQLRAGENVSETEGRVQISGQVAVMMINERLLQALLQKNPGLSFAMEESFPMKGFYADAAPLGPLLELNASGGQAAWTPDQAAQSLDYWKSATAAVLADPEAAASDTTLKTWSHDAVAAANLLSAHGFTPEAEQAYRYSAQLWPSSAEAASGLAEVLTGAGRAAEATQVLEDFVRNYPNERAALDKARGKWTLSVDATVKR
jgi:tetratricopeptide (TPR) repeat protein